MQMYSTYSVKIKHYCHIFRDTVEIYRRAVDFLIDVCLKEWASISAIKEKNQRQSYVEKLCHVTKSNQDAPYGSFDRKFYKFPSYLRRGAIDAAIGMVSSYKSNLKKWESSDPATRGRKPSCPRAGYAFPCLYKEQMYEPTGSYEAKIKIYIRNTWDWLVVQIRKSDMDYIRRKCSAYRQCPPTLCKRGHEWFLDFPFEENVNLTDKEISEQKIVAVDLGLLSSATVSVMDAGGAVLGRHFLHCPSEYDSLSHAVNRIKKAQRNRNYHTPRLWARAKGITADIAVKTANFIIDTAEMYNADVIVMEHLDVRGKKRGSKKQRLHLWRSQYVQSMVKHKAHQRGMHFSCICPWGTSRLAFDGSGTVERGKRAGLKSYSECRFSSGKVYNCDLNASYNIGSRYFIREILKSLPEKERLAIEAKVPRSAKRSTCTLSTLINLDAELSAIRAALSPGRIAET